MKAVDLCLHPEWIIPIEPFNAVFKSHSLVVHQQKILDILPTNECKQRYLADKNINLPDHVLMPGLINSHTHVPMNLFRGLADDLPLHTWLNDYIWPAEQKFVNEQFTQLGSQLAIAELLQGGVTCFNDMYFFPDIIAKSAVQAGIRAATSIHIMDTPCPWGSSLEEYWQKGEQFYAEYHDNSLITPTIATHAPYTVSNATLKETLIKQQHYQCKLNIHLHETQYEIEQSLKEYKKRPLRRLADLNALSPDLIAIHMVHINDEDLAIAKDTGIQVVTCPESNLKLASGICPVHLLLNKKINVAIGTDSSASNNDLDMFSEMRLTALLSKAIANNPTTCPAYTALTMATLNGAKALGIEKSTGSLLPGKMADMIAVDVSGINSLPLYSAPSQMTYATNRSQVTHVWIQGEHVVQDKQIQTLNTADLITQAQDFQTRIQDYLNANATEPKK